ncbi:MAG: hypothetical protein HY897_17400 [Deltaproteobacteria bacterium]|nr:hypothetical protein [Deltaproteobacteria bacterium]
MNRRNTTIICASVWLFAVSCIPLAERGDDGQPCFRNGKCLPGLVCNDRKV